MTRPVPPIRLRDANPDDQAVLEHWDTQPHLIEVSGDDGGFDWEHELPRRPPWREFLIAELDGRPIGFIQIIDPAEEETRYWGDIGPNLRAIDIWIGEENDIGRGYGTVMMDLALERCFAPPDVTAVLLDPLVTNTRAHRFYEGVGFECIDRRTFGPDDCYIYRLHRRKWRQREE